MSRSRRPDNRDEERGRGLPLRVAMMDTERRQKARKLRRKGHSPEEIAAKLQATPEEVVAALGALRGRRTNPNHINLSVTAATGKFFRSLALPDEPTWQTMERVEIMVRGLMRPPERRTPPRPTNDDQPGPQGRLGLVIACFAAALAAFTLPAKAAEPGCVTLSVVSEWCPGQPLTEPDGGWTGLPPDIRVSGWHRLGTSYGPHRAFWWDSRAWVWRVEPGSYSAEAPKELVEAGYRYQWREASHDQPR